MGFTDDLKFDDKGLLSAIVQDHETSEILMFAFVNKEAVEKTIETRKMHYWSRSRQKLWLKGESSGHVQSVKSIAIDCDQDALLFKVEQEGGACHEGYRSCFFRELEDGELKIVGEKVFDKDAVYKKSE
ncbi:MAG: phosphoribosyl-AMP cyclohydrolase [Planctomycetota bacterium]|jgi:phosphoribosyl-AMP cyclohydrolase|nr:phosphoribosyl-AMP cyclohydrolase [Planctomycetota bacterium]MDP7248543.1 phosphoribosyl-AMP cyclohydrolase [Planctomycetota bacterium]